MQAISFFAVLALLVHPAAADTTIEAQPEPAAREALDRGLAWLAKNQEETDNWGSSDLGLVSLGALAFLADGHKPGEGEYGKAASRALKHVLSHAQDSGLFNRANKHRAIYNHGLATMVLGQAVALGWMEGEEALQKAVRLSLHCQCEDGGWNYEARAQRRGHDLSLLSAQIGGMASAQQAGVKLPDELSQRSLDFLRSCYHAAHRRRFDDEEELKKHPGQFKYSVAGGPDSVAMACAGVVSLHKLGVGDDWRAKRSLKPVSKFVERLAKPSKQSGRIGLDAYTLWYLTQAMHFDGAANWDKHFAKLRGQLIASQRRDPHDLHEDGHWRFSRRVGGKPGQLFATSTACLALAMPQKKLPMWTKK